MQTVINKESSTVQFATGEQLKQEGMQSSLDHANEKTPKWGDLAYDFLKKYASENRLFMTEDIRRASSGKVPEPPSKRAWGAIIRKAKKENIVEWAGFGKVSNPKAHRATASAWQSKVYGKLF